MIFQKPVEEICFSRHVGPAGKKSKLKCDTIYPNEFQVDQFYIQENIS